MSAAPSINVDATALAAENEAASKVILALLRLAQQSTLYADNNQAQKQALEICASAVAAYSEASGRNLTIFFSDRAVYVGRRLLRANRNTYAAAEQLRELLGRMGVSQITIAHDVPLAELRAVQAAFGKLLR
ncbi:MAG: hypothetical protein KC731_29895, partial [Myxococcales bacterium]|nr:hypothetical protein [Myxococcales bacterium]